MLSRDIEVAISDVQKRVGDWHTQNRPTLITVVVECATCKKEFTKPRDMPGGNCRACLERNVEIQMKARMRK